jgi:hypothetical protein
MILIKFKHFNFDDLYTYIDLTRPDEWYNNPFYIHIKITDIFKI